MDYPIRCVIIDVEGHEVFPGLIGQVPEISKPHIGEHGLAEEMDETVKITLDDNRGILYGYECWWIPEKDWEEAQKEIRERDVEISPRGSKN